MANRIIVHIGTGKTGSTAFQKHLRKSRKDLINQNSCCWRLNLKHVPTLEKRDWQIPGGTGILQRMHLCKAFVEVRGILEGGIGNTKSDMAIIWSNESIAEMSILYLPVLQEFTSKYASEFITTAWLLSMILCIISACKQWCVKHKSNLRGVKAFMAWVNKNKEYLGCTARLNNWAKGFPFELNLLDYYSIDVVVEYFRNGSDIPRQDNTDASKSSNNSTLEGIALVLYALYNNQSTEPFLPVRMTALIQNYRLPENHSPIQRLSSIYPSQENVNENYEFIANETTVINEMLGRHKEAPFDEKNTTIKVKNQIVPDLINGIPSNRFALIV